MPLNCSSPEYLTHHRTRKNRVSPVSWASPAHMNSSLEIWYSQNVLVFLFKDIEVWPYEDIKEQAKNLRKAFRLSCTEIQRRQKK